MGIKKEQNIVRVQGAVTGVGVALYVLHIGGREYSNPPIQSSLPPLHFIFANDVNDVIRLDGQFVIFIGFIGIQYPALTHSCREGK